MVELIILKVLFLICVLLRQCKADKFDEHRIAFNAFKLQHNKNYGLHEESKRFAVFSINFDHIAEHNRKYEEGLTNFKMGINEYVDWELDEFQKYSYGQIMEEESSLEKKTYYEGTAADSDNSSENEISNGRMRNGRQLTIFNTGVPYIPPHNAKAPEHIDWRELGGVTPVKKQKKCGACWTFATTGALEGQLFRKTGKLISLSEQQLIDCTAGIYRGNGCHGGLKELAFVYVRHTGLNSEEAYPYEAKQNCNCKFNARNVSATCRGYMKIQPRDEHAMAVALAKHGPIAATIDGSCLKMRFYKEGIFDEHNCKAKRMNHGVLIVGYNRDNRSGLDYWIIKNSWGSNWGMNGFAYIPRNVNFAGIAKRASFPIV